MLGILLPVSDFLFTWWYLGAKIGWGAEHGWPLQVWSVGTLNPEVFSSHIVSVIEEMRTVS